MEERIVIEQILSEAESLLPESHVAILAREVKRLRERPDAEALQKLLNDAYRKGNQDAHAARDACTVIMPETAPVAWIVGGLEGDHFTDFDKAKTIAATYGIEPTPLYLHPPQVDANRLAALESIAAKIEALALGPDGRAWTPLHYREFARGELRNAQAKGAEG
jgi:hypothetical protein